MTAGFGPDDGYVASWDEDFSEACMATWFQHQLVGQPDKSVDSLVLVDLHAGVVLGPQDGIPLSGRKVETQHGEFNGQRLGLWIKDGVHAETQRNSAQNLVEEQSRGTG